MSSIGCVSGAEPQAKRPPHAVLGSRDAILLEGKRIPDWTTTRPRSTPGLHGHVG